MVAPKSFVSYSSKDHSFTQHLATDLIANGVDAWYDRWEISPGDSFVERLNEGLAGCEIFLVVLSQASVRSRWVTEELNAATIARIERQARLIPLKIEECAVPPLLEALQWVDFQKQTYDSAFRELLKAIFRQSDKPELGTPPAYIGAAAIEPVSGLTPEATRLLTYLVDAESQKQFSVIDGPMLQQSTSLDPDDINDAVDELESVGAVEVHKGAGTAPFLFHYVTVTSEAFFLAEGLFDYDPKEDVRIVAAALGALRSSNGEGLKKETKLDPARINRAVEHLDRNGLVVTRGHFGTAPYSFHSVEATPAMRRALRNESDADLYI